ncbi:hypothetical protein [Sphingomonas sp. S2-65]|uniref:hypothetical protein n=1 Tax=Sphingomonas sp. S2-65 TaxID=2903960 RepID=UPI001F398D37|nr:hypothetical protein [Sphingomonas sp. S2-65]UYY60118.1 hypothetical protein LZ586_08585 [Sphingomonas sp. S2-65]
MISNNRNGGNPPLTAGEGQDDMEGQSGSERFPVEGQALPGAAWTFEAVQERLVEAVITCWRHPDRERAWQQVRSTWPEVLREQAAGDYDARGGDGSSSDVAIRPAALTRRDMGEMEEAFGWLDSVAPAERKLVGLALVQLAAGKREVSWRRLLRPMGLARGSDGLRMRYARALSGVAARLNGGNPRGFASTP